MLPGEAARELLDCLAEEFAEKHRQGQEPAIEDFVERFPAHATRIRDLFPALLVMEELRAAGKITIADTTPGANGTALAITKLGGYSILREIGRGGMGVVYEAIQHSLARRVALKVLPLCAAIDPERRERFAREAKAAGRLDHPNIVPVYDVGEHDGHSYFSMKYVEGTTLADRLEIGPLEPRDAAMLLLTVVRAIAETHRRGVLHRDLKPSNILLDQDNRPLITDFGLAKGFDADRDISRTNATLGTPSYMAPEQALGISERIGVATDVYGLGAILYHALTARPPFRSATVVDTLRQVAHDDPTPPRQLNGAIDRDLDTICMRCLEKDPARRYATAGALADDLEQYLSGRPIQARPVGRVKRAIRWCKRSPMRATAVVLLLVTCAVSVAAYLTTSAALRNSEESHQQTREVVDHFLRRVSEDPRFDQRGMQTLRRDLLENALTHYQRFIEQRSDDASLQEELSDTYFRIGLIKETIGDLALACEAFRKAEAMQRALAEMNPQQIETFDALSKTLSSAGRVHYRSGHHDLARECYVEVEQLRQHLVDQFPQEPEYRRLLANATMNLGLLEKAVGDFVSARRRLTGAEQIRRKLLSEESPLVDVRRDLAKGLFNSAQLEITLGDRAHAKDDAIQHHTAGKSQLEEAIEHFETLVHEAPEHPDQHHQLALCYSVLGDVLRRLGSEKVTEWHQQVVERLEVLAQDNPHVIDYQVTLGGIYLNLGQAEFQSGQPIEALEFFREARRIYKALARLRPDQPQIQRDYAVALRAIGEIEAIRGRRTIARKHLTEAHAAFAQLAERHSREDAYATQRDACTMGIQKVDEQLGKVDVTVW